MMRKLAFAAVLVASTAGAVPQHRIPSPGCQVVGKKSIAFGDKTMKVALPLYDKKKPLGAVCTEDRSVVVGQNTIFVLPGSKIFGDKYMVEADISLSQDLPSVGKRGGISAWTLVDDDVFFMTKDGTFWATNLYEKNLSAYGLAPFKGGSSFDIRHSGGIVFVSQKNENGQCLVASELKENRRLRTKIFEFDSCKGAHFEGRGFVTDGQRFTITVENGVDGTYVSRVEQSQ